MSRIRSTRHLSPAADRAGAADPDTIRAAVNGHAGAIDRLRLHREPTALDPSPQQGTSVNGLTRRLG